MKRNDCFVGMEGNGGEGERESRQINRDHFLALQPVTWGPALSPTLHVWTAVPCRKLLVFTLYVLIFCQ